MVNAQMKIVNGKRQIWVADATGTVSYIFIKSEIDAANKRAINASGRRSMVRAMFNDSY